MILQIVRTFRFIANSNLESKILMTKLHNRAIRFTNESDRFYFDIYEYESEGNKCIDSYIELIKEFAKENHLELVEIDPLNNNILSVRLYALPMDNQTKQLNKFFK